MGGLRPSQNNIGGTMKKRTIETIGNIALVVLAIGAVIALGIDSANRTETRLAARMAK